MTDDDAERRRLLGIARILLDMRRRDERLRASPLFRQQQETVQFWQDLIREAEQEEAARSRQEPPVTSADPPPSPAPPPSSEPELNDAACNALAAALATLAETADVFAANASGVQEAPELPAVDSSPSPPATLPTEEPPPPPSALELKDAPLDGKAIRDAIRTVNSKGEALNLNELVTPVKNVLKGEGLKASKGRIQEIAREKEFAETRRPSGVRRS